MLNHYETSLSKIIFSSRYTYVHVALLYFVFCAGEPFRCSETVSGAQQGAQGLHGKKVKSTLPYFVKILLH